MKLVSWLALSIVLVVVCTTQLPAQPHITQGDVPAERGFRKVTLVQGLEHPWGFDWLPNGDILVTERPGRLRRMRGDRLVSDPIAGIPKVFDSGQGGLLDISLHPRFEENRKVYFTYAHGISRANRTRVASAVFKGDALENWQVVFEVMDAKSGSQHFGSRLVWMPDGTLLVSIGDGGNPPIRLGLTVVLAPARVILSSFSTLTTFETMRARALSARADSVTNRLSRSLASAATTPAARTTPASVSV